MTVMRKCMGTVYVLNYHEMNAIMQKNCKSSCESMVLFLWDSPDR